MSNKNKKLSRREHRETVFLLAYQSAFNDDDIEEIARGNIEQFELTASAEELDGIIAKAKAVAEYTTKADDIIAKYSKTRKVERIPKVSAAIMRVALYEMDCDDDVPDKVAVNEAIELCKKYADKQDCGFISGLLGSYFRDKSGDNNG